MSTEQPAYVCSHVFENSRPVLLVCHDGDDWQFLCGGEHPAEDIPMVIGINHLFDRDPTLLDVMDLANNCEAERSSVDMPWTRTEPTLKS